MLSGVDFKENRLNLYIVTVSVGFDLIPMDAPNVKLWMPRAINPLLDSGILLAAISAVTLKLFFNGAKHEAVEGRETALANEA